MYHIDKKKKVCVAAVTSFNITVFQYLIYVNNNILKSYYLLRPFQAVITLKVINGLYPGVTTVELDNLAAETAATMTTKHPDYAILAARIAVSNLHKETKKVFSGKILFCHRH